MKKWIRSIFKKNIPPIPSFFFNFYREITENKLPIRYISNPKNDSLECGWFVFENTLILPDVIVQYHSCEKQWFFNEYDGGHDLSSFSIDEYFDKKINEINKCLGGIICDNAIALIDISQIDNVDEAEKEKRFLIYDGDRQEVLKSFCDSANR